MDKGASGSGAKADAKTPNDFLKAIKGKTVMVKLNSGVGYKGVLVCLDGFMVRRARAGWEPLYRCAPPWHTYPSCLPRTSRWRIRRST